ncbi:MAG: DUF4276 family protein [Planctomycetota bacterium]
MLILKILVEGETEELFVRELLYEHLLFRGVIAQSALLKTRRDRNERAFKGGGKSFLKMRRHIMELLGKNRSGVHVTTMLDFYGLPGEFPGQTDLPPNASFRGKVAHLEGQFEADIHSKRFIPYLQVHEFEALLFSDIGSLVNAFTNGPEKKTELEAILNTNNSDPEEINLGKDTAPSKRLLRLFPKHYSKKQSGLQIAKAVGLPALRSRCAHFNQWLIKLEELGDSASKKVHGP